MDDAVDRVMASYENLPALDRLGREEIRVKVSQYQLQVTETPKNLLFMAYCAAVNAVDFNLAVPHGNFQLFQFLVSQHQVPNGSFVRKIDPNVNGRRKKKSRTYGMKLQSRFVFLSWEHSQAALASAVRSS